MPITIPNGIQAVQGDKGDTCGKVCTTAANKKYRLATLVNKKKVDFGRKDT